MKRATQFFGTWWWIVTIAVLPSPAWAQAGGNTDPENRLAAEALFTNGVLHVLQLELPEAGVRSLSQDPRTYVKATLREGATVHSNVLMRLKGGAGSFRKLDNKPGLTLKLDEPNGVFHGLKKFHLNNTVQDGTYLSEWIASDMFRAAGVPAARVAHAVVELNGRRLGLYVLLESVNREFLAHYFQNPRGNVYGQGPNADITRPLQLMGGHENNNGEDLRALAAACREADAERLRVRLPQVLDLERFLSFMAMETMLGHWDGYTFNVKNYLVYHDPGADRMIFIPHDLDQLMRSTDQPIMPRAQGIVSRAVLRVPEFRERYRERVGELCTNVFVAPVLAQRIDERAALLAAQLKSVDPELAGQFVNRARSLKSRLLVRGFNLTTQVPSPDSGQPGPGGQ